MNEEECRGLREDVNRLQRNLYGENSVYKGLISRMDAVESDLKDLKEMGKEAKEERKDATEERERRKTSEQSRKKWVAGLALTVVGGALMSLFNLAINLLQTYAAAP